MAPWKWLDVTFRAQLRRGTNHLWGSPMWFVPKGNQGENHKLGRGGGGILSQTRRAVSAPLSWKADLLGPAPDRGTGKFTLASLIPWARL